jgi:hypothetical protein
MSRNSAENWESLNHKSIRANDGSLVGNVDAIDDKPVSMSTEVACTRYKIPKHLVKGFSGQEVFFEIGEDGSRKIQWQTGRRLHRSKTRI